MKTKIIGILVCMLLIATALPAVGTMTEKEIPASFGICSNSLDQQITKQTTMTGDRGSLFMQLPTDDLTYLNWRAYISDTGANWKTYDDFWDITSPICDIHWWGQCAKKTDDWHSYDPTGMTVQIQFYDDDNGQPGTLLCSYDSVNPSITPTGIMYNYIGNNNEYFELYYFETDLDPCCEVSNGWVSIQSTYCPSGGWLTWINSTDGNKNMYQFSTEWRHYEYDVSFMLTDGEEPDLEINVKSGLGATIEITNSGDETLTGIPVDVVVYGGILGKINVHVRETISLDPDETKSVGTGMFLGLGKIAIGVIADDVVEYHSGLQLFIFTIIQ